MRGSLCGQPVSWVPFPRFRQRPGGLELLPCPGCLYGINGTHGLIQSAICVDGSRAESGPALSLNSAKLTQQQSACLVSAGTRSQPMGMQSTPQRGLSTKVARPKTPLPPRPRPGRWPPGSERTSPGQLSRTPRARVTEQPCRRRARTSPPRRQSNRDP